MKIAHRRRVRVADGIVVRAERDVNMGDRVARRITSATRNSFGQNLSRVSRSIHLRVSNRQTKRRTTRDALRFLVKRNRFVVASHLAIKRGQQWLAINECRIQLQCAFAGLHRFIV